MKYYQQLARLGAFTLEDASTIMHGLNNASKILNKMISGNSVKRIKKNLYTCIDLVSGAEVADRFVIATHINDSSFIGFHSAFEFYGFYNQVYNEVQVLTKNRFSNFDTEEYKYKCFLSDVDEQIDTIRTVKVSSIERTIVDSINMLGKVMDVEELVKCLQLVHIVNVDKLKSILKAYDKEILYRKTGYFLSFFAKQLNINADFFDYCKENSDFSYRGKISGGELNDLVYIKEWSLYGYKNVFALSNKGGNEDV